METTTVQNHVRVTTETHRDFIEAVSLCAELEGLCVPSGAPRLLPFIGMARNELTDYGTRVPSHCREMSLSSVHDGVQRLEQLLTAMIGRADDLLYAVRLHEAREILREGSTA
jgi:hypothetical protein